MVPCSPRGWSHLGRVIREGKLQDTCIPRNTRWLQGDGADFSFPERLRNLDEKKIFQPLYFMKGAVHPLKIQVTSTKGIWHYKGSQIFRRSKIYGTQLSPSFGLLLYCKFQLHHAALFKYRETWLMP